MEPPQRRSREAVGVADRQEGAISTPVMTLPISEGDEQGLNSSTTTKALENNPLVAGFKLGTRQTANIKDRERFAQNLRLSAVVATWDCYGPRSNLECLRGQPVNRSGGPSCPSTARPNASLAGAVRIGSHIHQP